MNYAETLAWLYEKLPMFTRVGAEAYRKDITNTVRLCAAIGDPQHRFKTIHVAGTNGKGSVSHMLASILQSAGYRTGLYTSPHLRDFRERIKVNGQLCPQVFVTRFTERITTAIEEISPSFFEVTVAMAFEYFAEEQVDIAVIETGLGGRLDSTNIIMPLLSIITNIGWDHMNLLGDTLELIAGEKAGIIKENTPVIIGETIPETRPVFERRAADCHAPIVFAQERRYVTSTNYDPHRLEVEVADVHTDEHTRYQLDLPGIYQAKNILSVLEAVHQLRRMGFDIGHSALQQGLLHVKRQTGLHGRWEIIQSNPDVVLDVAHNADGVRQMLAQLELSTYTQLHIVIGMVKDKDVDRVLELLPKYAAYYFTRAQIPRALEEDKLQQQAAQFGLSGQTFPNVPAAVNAALLHAGREDLVLVCGSVFVVGEVV